jgi:UDP-glucuronate decarboxylase
MPKQILERKNILITGGAGFIGSFLCDRLVRNNNIICLDNFISGSQSNIEHLLRNANFVFIKHDIVEPLDLESYPELEKFKIKFQGIQEIYNLACPMSPKDFDKYKIETALTNSVGTANMLELALKFKAKFLQASTSTIYGGISEDIKHFKEGDYQPVNPITPRSCYDEGKRFAESLTVTYRDVHNIDAKIVRVFRTYGPRVRLFSGEMVPDFVVQAIDNKDLVIYGDEKFSTSLCYVDDIVEGCIKTMASGEPGPINLGSPDDYSLVEVAKKIIEMTGSSSKIVFEPPLLFMTQLGLPDITLAKDKLSWIPVTTLEKGLEKTIEYAKAHKVLIGIQKEI